MSISYQARPWRADAGCAWWLLCQPSPQLINATHQLLRESSGVSKRRLPQVCAAELIKKAECQEKTTRKQMPHKMNRQPPAQYRIPIRTNVGTRFHRDIQT